MSEASGDWFFFEKSGSGRLAHFVMCDISGHGVQAALVVSACKTVLSIMRLAEHSPFESSEFLLQYAERLNRILFLNGHGEHTATMVGLTFDFEAGKVFCVDCGHPFPVLHTFGGGHFEALTTTSCDPIGFYEDAKFTMQERKLNFGDCLIAHSDGIPLNRGRRILKKYFSEIDNAPLISAQRLFETLVHHLKKEGLEFAEDDVSLVIFRRTA
jgi:serine phosphatase RsbU (regulator of sigma subunit)